MLRHDRKSAKGSNGSSLQRSKNSQRGTSDLARLLHLSITNEETDMDEMIRTTLTRAAALLAEAAASLQDASVEAMEGKNLMARGGSEYALGRAGRALALIEACHTLQDDANAPT